MRQGPLILEKLKTPTVGRSAAVKPVLQQPQGGTLGEEHGDNHQDYGGEHDTQPQRPGQAALQAVSLRKPGQGQVTTTTTTTTSAARRRGGGGVEPASAVSSRVRQQLESAYGSVSAAWLSLQGRCGSRISRAQLEQGLLEAGVAADDAFAVSLAMVKIQTGSGTAITASSGKASPGRHSTDVLPDAGAAMLAASELQAVLAPGGLPQTVLDAIRQECGLALGKNSPIVAAELLQDTSSVGAHGIAGATGSIIGFSQGVMLDGARQDTLGASGAVRTHSPGLRKSRPSTSSHPWEEGTVDHNINIHKVPNGISHRNAKTILAGRVTSPERDGTPRLPSH